MSARRLIAGYALWMVILAGAHLLFPRWHMATWSVIGASGAAAVIGGALRNRPRHRLPWVLLGVSMATFAAGHLTYDPVTTVLAGNNPFPSRADLFRLATCVLINTGMILLARSGAAYRDRAALLDSVVLTSGVGLLYWIFLIGPRVVADAPTVVGRAIPVAYPLSDVLLLATVTWILTAGRRTPAIMLLAAGTAGLLISDVLYGLARLNGAWRTGGPVDIGWIVLYAGFGAAALHPSMVGLTEPGVPRPGEVSRRRLTPLVLSSLVAPAVLLIEAARGDVRDAAVIAVLSAVIFLLTWARLAGLARTYRAAVARERGLREAGAALVSATDAGEVAMAVRAAVARLLPATAPHRAVLVVNDPDGPPQAYPDPREVEPRAPAALEPAAGPAGRTGATVPRRVEPSGVDPGGDRVTRVVTSSTLDPWLTPLLARQPFTLCCPLVLQDRPSGDPHVGVLMVAGDERSLLALRGSVDVLASQAALALERVWLTGEINRRISEEYFRTLVHNTADVILIVDDDNRVRYASPAAGTVFGAAGSHLGRSILDLVHPDDRILAGQLLDLSRTDKHPSDSADWTVVRADGSTAQVEVTSRDLRRDRAVRGLVVTLRDVTERRRLERELTHRAFHDSLTGLANRVLFQERVQQAVARVRRTGAVVGVLLVDLDDFKVVNDSMGHETGDALLVAVGQRLAGALRAHDTAARLGGDEFAALIDDAADPRDVEQVAARIVAALAEPFPVRGGMVHSAASVGVATTAEAHDGRDLLRQADLALYVAKGAGKGQWRRYQSNLHAAIVRRLELRAELDRAVADGAFTLRYQPIVALDGGRAVGFEALIRWDHPTRGLMAPGQFINVAEETGLIVPIGDWVLENAMAAAAGWYRARGPERAPYVSVNVSARQFRAPGFIDKVKRELQSSGLRPDRLMVEITESLLLRDDERVWAELQELRVLGVKIAIDDFGTGYSSLSYLQHVPIDVLKIDRSFVDTIASSARQRALVDGIVRLGHTLGLQIVAEGIERTSDRDLLLEIGCPFGQGYLFARPLSHDDAVRWLSTERVAA